MAKMRLRYVEEFIDRHGKPHRYFRRAGKRVRLPGLPGSAEFMTVYQAALDVIPLPKAEAIAPRTAPGTVHWLVRAYLSSPTFTTLAPETRRTRANILGNFRTLRAMFKWAVSEGKLPDDPTVGVTRQKLKNTTEGYPTWTDAEMAQFIARHPLGTKAYLAFVLLRDTGVRRGDAVRLGPQHIRHDLLPKQPHGYLSIVQGKPGR